MKQFKARELAQIVTHDEGEPLVALPSGILVRTSVSDKLSRLNVPVKEGYRSPEKQERMFLEQFAKSGIQDLQERIEYTHTFVALPSVAGHPTGGAVDVTIQGLDMGGEIADFSNPHLMPTYCETITKEQQSNRILLHDLMVSEGFAPFYGEWWHFSYGDKEWAAMHEKSHAIYGTIYLQDHYV